MNYALMLTYNSAALTREAVKSVLAQDLPITLLVMDDGSTDNTLPYLRSLYPRVITNTVRHSGVSALWNKGLRYLFGLKGASAVLVVNNDVRLRPDTFRLLWADGGAFVTCVGTSSGAQFPGGPPSGEKRPHPDFSCFLIRRECWDKVGLFDEQMKFYCSDGDMHLRMHKAGITSYCIDLPFFHYSSGTLKQASEEDRERILHQTAIDREVFAKKWGCQMGSPEYYTMFLQEEATNETNTERVGQDGADVGGRAVSG